MVPYVMHIRVSTVYAVFYVVAEWLYDDIFYMTAFNIIENQFSYPDKTISGRGFRLQRTKHRNTSYYNRIL